MPPTGESNPLVQETVGGMLATSAARGLLALGATKGDTVALWLPNRPEWLFAQYGCALIGAVVVALDPRATARALRDALRQTDTTTVLCGGLRDEAQRTRLRAMLLGEG